VDNESVLFKVTKGLYGLPQAGLLAQQRLKVHLANAGYNQCPAVPCLFQHVANGVSSTLVVDNFGIKYSTRAGANDLVATLQELYPLKVELTGKHYLGMTITRDRKNRTLSLSMLGYTDKVLQQIKYIGSA